MRPLPPVRLRCEVTGWALVAAAGAVSLLGAVLPWVQVPVGFEQLRVRGTGRPLGWVALVVGVGLVVMAGYAARRPGLRFPANAVAVVAVVLGAVAALGYADVQRLLHEDQPGLGVHPGSVGPGVRVVGLSALVLLGTALYVRRVSVRTRADARQRERPDDE